MAGPVAECVCLALAWRTHTWHTHTGTGPCPLDAVARKWTRAVCSTIAFPLFFFGMERMYVEGLWNSCRAIAANCHGLRWRTWWKNLSQTVVAYVKKHHSVYNCNMEAPSRERATAKGVGGSGEPSSSEKAFSTFSNGKKAMPQTVAPVQLLYTGWQQERDKER